MSWLAISIVANAILAVLLAVTLLARPIQLRKAKLETFAGVLNALTYGLAPTDLSQRWDRLSLGFKFFLGIDDPEEVKWRLYRASVFRYFRPEPTVADVMDEAGRLAIVDLVKNGDEHEPIWDYFESKVDGKDGFEQELHHRFPAEELGKAQLQLEKQLIEMYQKSLRLAS